MLSLGLAISCVETEVERPSDPEDDRAEEATDAQEEDLILCSKPSDSGSLEKVYPSVEAMSRAAGIDMGWYDRASDGLPMGQSRPGAATAIFVDFDGGTIRWGSGDYESVDPADLDGDPDEFDADERSRIREAVELLAAAYWDYDINVTTDPDAYEDSEQWAWVMVTSSYSGSGMAKKNSIGSLDYATGYAGQESVLDPDSSEKDGYLLVHEVGHMFGLNHNGTYDGDYVEYGDFAEGDVGAFMGGRDSQFTGGYVWRSLVTKYEYWQDPDRMIYDWAGYAGGGSPSEAGLAEPCMDDADCESGNCHEEGMTDRCRPASCGSSDDPDDREFCELHNCGPCGFAEGDCDSDDQCLSGNCHEEGSRDRCRPLSCGSSDDPGDGEFCELYNCGPCGFDEGDCDRNDQCVSGYCRQHSGTDECRG